MNWHAATVPADRLVPLLDRIRNAGGTIAGSRPDVDGVHVTWTDGSCVDAPTTGRPAGGR
ncbi:hypothetical protein [Nocardioides antri]|uniref:Uncharacterized protein n=1 Tax=Nocardioides antri TaxID=2607659 RepID=A0A5B1M725_9ACTN|nr:hypothetical protein [Nocardioides antri]KAA1428661.1 hypothetical protein F0U47_00080 [Nocardioides antri]